DPQASEFHHNRGTANLGLGRIRSAHADFETALRLAPANCLARLGLANARYHLGDADALEDYDRSFALDHALAVRTLVNLFRNDLRRDRDGVFADCVQHLGRNPQDVPALVRRGLSLFLEGREAEARETCELIY